MPDPYPSTEQTSQDSQTAPGPCGKAHKLLQSPYCPSCGECLMGGHPLSHLLDYVTKELLKTKEVDGYPNLVLAWKTDRAALLKAMVATRADCREVMP